MMDGQLGEQRDGRMGYSQNIKDKISEEILFAYAQYPRYHYTAVAPDVITGVPQIEDN